jgi:hypothetical protein
MALDQNKERVHPVQERPHIPVMRQREEVLHLAQQPLLVIRREGVKPGAQGPPAASIIRGHGVVLHSVAVRCSWLLPSCSTISMASATMALASAEALAAVAEAIRLKINPSQ